MTSANSLMRLMGEPGEERPMDRYIRLRKDISLWYDEVKQKGLSDEEIKILEPYYLPNFGVPATQEDLMEICMDEKIAHFSLKEANGARKVVAKKHMDEIPILKEKFISQCPNRNFGEYVWKTTMGPQMGYSFSRLHSLAYTFVGIQTLYLATNFPSIYWNCACLIVNAGGTELLNADDINEDDDSDTDKKKNKTANYGKISVALGCSKKAGLRILPPDVNKSDLIFTPDNENQAIIYGLKGITRIGTALVYEIINNRPYTSINDFLNKVKVNKTQMISLIKAGAFDNFYDNRKEAMAEYINLIADKKKRITLQNMAMLIKKDLIPKEYRFEVRVFNFNKYLKQFKDGEYYKLDDIAMNFYVENYDTDLLINAVIDNEYSNGKIKQTIWDSIYKKAMDPIRIWMKENQQEILNNLNSSLYDEVKEKYATGDIDKWDMDALGTYCHDHELSKLKQKPYGIVNFEDLDKEPVITSEFQSKDGGVIRLYEISRICGTVIDKDKNKSTVTLLTPTMQVVSVKVWKNQYAKWDRQISRKNPDGTKTIVEKSFFARGNKLIITGIRRDDDFVPKKYKNTPYPLFEKIEEMSEDGFITSSKTERAETEE